MENQITSHVLKGLLISAFFIIFSVCIYVFNLFDISWLSWISYLVLVGALVYGAILYSNQNNHNVTFGNLFAHGFKTTAVVIVITSVFSFISIKFLFPDMIDKVLAISRKQMEKNPQLSDEMVENALAMTKKYFLPFAIGGGIITNGIIGAIGSLIGAGIAKKDPNPFQDSAA
jgi:hypothetical protein